MSLFMVAIAFSLVASPLWTQHMFRAVYDWEEKQIAIDNAGIALGQEHRTALNEVVTANLQMARLERQHHVWHQCAAAPSPRQVLCRTMDLAWEQKLQKLSARALMQLVSRWAAARGRTEEQLRRWSGQIVISEALRPPVFRAPCPVCAGSYEWEVEEEEVDELATMIRYVGGGEIPLGVRKVAVGSSLRDGSPWNYALEVLP